MWPVDTLRDRVAAERNRRGWSVRTAAQAGGISNTLWGRFENGDSDVTPKVRHGVARAFDWPDEWPERTPELPQLAEIRDEAAERFGAILDALRSMSSRLEQLERRISQPER